MLRTFMRLILCAGLATLVAVVLSGGPGAHRAAPRGSDVWDLWSSENGASVVYVEGVSFSRCVAAKWRWERTDPKGAFDCKER